MSYETLELGIAGPVATITLDRPSRLNALNAEMFAEIGRALDTVEADAGVRTLVITGAGRAFCSGQDLAGGLPLDSEGKPDLGTVLDTTYNRLVRRLKALRVPVVAGVNGPAVGAGASLALACDIAVIAQSAYLQQAFVRIGLMPDAGGTFFLTRALGPNRALALMMTGESMGAEEAKRCGLVHAVFPDESFPADLAAFAAKIAAGPLEAYRAMREAVAAAIDNDLAAHLELERRLQHGLGLTADFAEGVTAFREKRPPRFGAR